MSARPPTTTAPDANPPFAGTYSGGNSIPQQEVGPPRPASDAAGGFSSGNANVPLSTSATSMLDECRRELSSLRQVVKGAKSNKAASLALLTDASEVVVKLEDIVYNQALHSADREQLIHRVGHRALLAMDRAEGVVRKYGHGSAMKKLFQSSESVKVKFEDAAEELDKVAQVADTGALVGMRMVRMLSTQATGATVRAANETPTRTTTDSGATTMDHNYTQNTNHTAYDDSTDASAHAIPSGPLPTHRAQPSEVPSVADSQNAPHYQQQRAHSVQLHQTATAHHQMSTAPSGYVDGRMGSVGYANQMTVGPSRTMESAALSASTVSTVLSKTDGVAVVTEYEHRELFKGSKQAFMEAATSVELGSLNEDAGDDVEVLGSFLWLYSSKILGPDRMQMFNIVDGSRQAIQTDRGAVTVMHYDDRGVLWTGHKSGQVTAWNVHSRKPYCKSIRVSSGQIRALTSDEAGTAWVGSDKGDVRRVTLAEQLLDSEVIGYELIVTGQLKHSGSGAPDISASHPVDANGMVINLRAKEKAHNGPVTAILAAAGRVWTSGGSPAFVCFKEWTQRGEFMNKRDLKLTGAAACMKIVSPFVAIRTGLAGDQGQRKATQADVRQQYQVLTAYANGTIGVWGPVNGILCQFIRIGRHSAPITGMAVLHELGMVATSHIDGKIRLRVPPRIVDKDRLSVSYSDQSVYSVNLNLMELVASKSGDSIMGVYAHKNGLSYATAATKTVFVSYETLGDIVVQSGSKLLRGLGNKLSCCSAEWASKNMAELLSDEIRGADESFSQMKSTMLFPQDAFQWMIDFAELTQTRVIGEGAFGKVYLGKWHETDVAIKALTSLGALGISAGQVASYATEADVKDALKTLEREVGLMVGMRHPNVILFLGVCPDPPCVVTEYCARGSLYDVLVEARERPNGDLARALTWYRRVSMMLDAAKGMLYLHSHKPTIVHRDLKSPNLLVDGNWSVKVTDFNLSRLADVSNPGVISSVVANNPRWHAPEIIRDALFGKPGDVYAFGLIMWEMITWMLPYDALSAFQMIINVGDKGGRPPIPDPSTGTARDGDTEWRIQGGPFPGYESYVDLMVRCWAQDPEKRPLFPEIISKLRDILSSFPDNDAELMPVYQSDLADDSADPNDPNDSDDKADGGKTSTVAFKASASSLPPHPPSPFGDDPPGDDNPSAASSPPPHPFDMHAGPFGGAASHPATPSEPFSLPSVAPTIVSPFDAAESGAVPDRRVDPARGVVDSVTEGLGSGARRP